LIIVNLFFKLQCKTRAGSYQDDFKKITHLLHHFCILPCMYATTTNTIKQYQMKTRKLIILGSSRSDGDTAKLTQKLKETCQWDLLDLNEYDITYFDYDHRNREDDFLPLMRKIIENYDVLILATPVYWYTMSGIMKVFFDRISDLLTIEKDLGRQLRGKSMAVITASGGNDAGDNFWIPFKLSAEYLGMKYITQLHTFPPEIDEGELLRFVSEVERFDN
jgi:NAD(P)H-dependent FMN reductase